MKNYLIIQIIISIFLIIAIYKDFKKYRLKTINSKEFIGWLILWLMVGIIFWLPQTTSILAGLLGIGRGVDLVIYTSIVVIFYLLFRIFVNLDKQQQEITKIVRYLAISEEEKKNK